MGRFVEASLEAIGAVPLAEYLLISQEIEDEKGQNNQLVN